jgi:hypothetical protein
MWNNANNFADFVIRMGLFIQLPPVSESASLLKAVERVVLMGHELESRQRHQKSNSQTILVHLLVCLNSPLEASKGPSPPHTVVSTMK